MSDMEKFKQLLSRLRETVEKGRDLYLRNETAVRMQLIDPVLSFLGWDLLNPLQVVPEDKIERGKADYCLMLERQDKRGLFVEAKNLSKNADDGLRGLMNYCADAGVLYGVSSNGQKWLLFRAFEVGKSRKERILWTVDIFEDPAEEVFAKLSQISRDNLPELDTRVRQANTVEGLINRCLYNLSPKVVFGICKAVRDEPEFRKLSCTNSELKEIVRGRLSSITKSQELSLAEEREVQAARKQRPKTARPKRPPKRPTAVILFGERFPTKLAYEILTTVATKLIQRNALSRKNIPVHAGSKRYLVDKSPLHPTGERFRGPKELPKDLWIETHFSSKDAERQACKLLKHCGYDASDLKILWK